MSDVNGFDTGLFCWADLATTDLAAAKSFYTSLFGWDVQDMPVPGDDSATYSMFSLDGRWVGGAAVQMEQERSQGVPPHWNLYVSVDDADGYAKRAEAAGGTVLLPAIDVGDSGRIAVVADSTGAVVGMWQAGEHRGFGVVNEPGAVDWNELMTGDTDSARAFYGEVFEWTGESFESSPNSPEYTVFRKGDAQVGGMMKNPEGMESIPPHWMLYYRVESCDATVAKIKELGGQVYFGPQSVPTVGTFATCADPQGAAFSILEPEPDAQAQ